MGKRLIGSQMSNMQTYISTRNRMIDLAEIVIKIKNLPLHLNPFRIYKNLLFKGSVCFFVDDELGMLYALPWISMGGIDPQGFPTKVQCYGENGYQSKILERGEFVIMYDNTSFRSILPDLYQFAERYANAVRTQDVNIKQQKTNRIWKTVSGQELTLSNMLNNIDENCDNVITYDGLDLDETQSILSPAPYVTDKLDEYKANLWNEFLTFIGVSNISINKKERMITDEVNKLQGGTICSKSVRYESRAYAIEQINEIFADYLDKPLELEFYDGVPSTYEDFEKVDTTEDVESEVTENDV